LSRQGLLEAALDLFTNTVEDGVDLDVCATDDRHAVLLLLVHWCAHARWEPGVGATRVVDHRGLGPRVVDHLVNPLETLLALLREPDLDEETEREV
jgi:hypothetical protein